MLSIHARSWRLKCNGLILQQHVNYLYTAVHLVISSDHPICGEYSLQQYVEIKYVLNLARDIMSRTIIIGYIVNNDEIEVDIMIWMLISGFPWNKRK